MADILAERQAREANIKQQHEQYLEDHPEVKGLLGDFISAALVEQPLDVFEFAREHFKGTATEVVEKAEPAAAAEDDDMGDAGSMDGLDDDLDDMVAASSGSSELTAYLKQVFESIDTDGSGSISRNELNAKLQADTELQQLLEAAGGDGAWFQLEQLDLDGDGEITWMEFESMLGDR